MRTLSLICCLLLVAAGTYETIVHHNEAGLIPMIIGTLSFLIIAPKTKKIRGYDPNHFMNR